MRQGSPTMNDTLTSNKSSGYATFSGMNFRKTAKLMFGRKVNYDADDEDRPVPVRRLQTAREYNKKFIMDRIQNVKQFFFLFLLLDFYGE